MELERRNNKIAVTLFWLSRIAKDLPIFSVIEHNQTLVEKVEIDGAEKKMESLENGHVITNGHVMTNGNGETVSSRKCTNHNKVFLSLFINHEF